MLPLTHISRLFRNYKMLSGLNAFNRQAASQRHLTKNSLESIEKSKLIQDMTSERFNRPVKMFEVLAMAAARQIVHITIPESLIRLRGEIVSLYTDKGGVLRVRSGPEAKDFFVQYCRVLGKQVKLNNPLAIHYPKYVTFSRNGVQYTLKHKNNVDQALGSADMIQRFIPPSGLIISKTILHWSRMKSTQKFHIISHADLRTRMLAKDLALDSDLNHTFALSLDLPFIASLQHLDYCEVDKVTRIQDEEMELLQTVRSVLEREELKPEELLEELVISYTTGLDGKRYFLSCTKALVKLRSVHLSRKISLQHIMASRPGANLLSLQAKESPDVQPEASNSYVKSKCFFAIASEHLSSVLANMEKMKVLAQKQREEKAKLRFETYGPNFLVNSIHRLYGRILAEPRLARYFAQSDVGVDHMGMAIEQVFSQGRYPSKVREIHRNMKISEKDFKVYLKEAKRAFIEEGASEEDAQAAIAYLSTFKCVVVSHYRGSLLELANPITE